MISGERVKRQRKVQIERGGIVCDDGGLARGMCAAKRGIQNVRWW